MLTLILGAASGLSVTVAHAADGAGAVVEPAITPPRLDVNRLKLPNFQMRQTSPLSEQARIRLSETLVEHSLQLAVTNAACDSTMSSSQCLEWLMSLSDAYVPRFASISLQNWSQTMPEIDAMLERVVSKDVEMQRWQLLRSLGIQARQTVAKLTREATQADRTTPEALRNLNSTFGVSRIEVVHRLVISGDRMIIDHMVIDRSDSNPRANVKVDSVGAQDLVDVTDALRANVDASMKTLADSTTKAIAKSRLKK